MFGRQAPVENSHILSLGVPDDKNLFEWSAVIRGVEGTPYEGGQWKVQIKATHNYPKEPPMMRFITPVCHPNVHLKTGEVCLDILKTQWSSTFTIYTCLIALISLFTVADASSPLNTDLANLISCGDKSASNALIRYYTKRFATSL